MSRNKSTEKFSLISKSHVSENDGVKFLDDDTQMMKVEGVSMAWKNLNVSAEIKTQRLFKKTKRNFKKIIHNANGYAERSNLVAILGTSGSGKSTLMSVLAKRHSGNLQIDGDVLVNGEKIQPELMRTISGFVYQDDFFYPTFTILEHLHFAARLKLDKRITSEFRKHLVNKILIDLGLTECADCLIGSSRYGEKKTIRGMLLQMNLSGGELKRISVATELLTNPPLLFCDEPTTGLDSFTALKLMTIMRKMTSQRGTTIICSIHQPSAQIYDLFHQIILLHDGKIAFNGTTKDALEFFQSIGYIRDKEQNPADFLIKNLTIVPGRELETADKESNICVRFKESKYAKYMYDLIEKETCEKVENNFNERGNVERISWFSMFCLVTYRNILCVTRDPFEQRIRIFYKLVSCIIACIIMMGTIAPTQEGIQSLKTIAYGMVAENSFSAVECIMNHFPEKIPMFLREYSNNMNSPLIFYLSNIISLIPQFLIDPILYVTLMYVLLELKRSWFTFLSTITISVLVYNSAVAFGILVSLATNNIFTAQTIGVTAGIFYESFSGIYMNVRSIPWLFTWVRYVSWMTYGVESLLILQLDGVDHIECSKAKNVPCLKNGEEVLESMGFKGDNLQFNLIMMCCIFLISHGLSFLTLKIRLYLKTYH